MRAIPINPGDLYNMQVGSSPYTVRSHRLPAFDRCRCSTCGQPALLRAGSPSHPFGLAHRRLTPAPQDASDSLKPPFVAGNDGLGVVMKVGPGVKNLSENDWVLPNKPALGTWRSLAVWHEKELLKMPADLLPVEYAAMLRAPPFH
jgi:hypothetical protein